MQFFLRIKVFLFLRNLHDVAERTHGAGHDRDLLHGLGVLLDCSNESMADFMVGNDPALLLAHDAVLLLLADQDLFNRDEQVLLGDVFALVLDGIDRRLVNHIGKIGADRPACCERNFLEVDGLVHPDVLGVNLQDRLTSLQVRALHDDPSVKAAGTKECLIQDLRAVRCAQDQDSLGRVKPVHLREELVQGLFSFFIASAVLRVTASADRIDLINENNAGRVFRCFAEKVPDTGCADADIELNEIRARQREERHMRLTCDRLGKKCFARSGRAHEQRSLRELCADGRIVIRIMQEIDDLDQRLLGLVLAGDVLEGNAGLPLDILLRGAAADAHDASASAHPAEEEGQEYPHQQNRQDIGQDKGYDKSRGIRHAAADNNVVLEHARSQGSLILRKSRIIAESRFLIGKTLLLCRNVDLVAVDLDARDIFLFHHGNKFRVGDLRRLRGNPAHKIADNQKCHHCGNQKHEKILTRL